MDLVKLKESVLKGDRRALAQAITLVESDRDDQQELRFQLLQVLLPQTGRSLRIGISGVPGVGKSTFIEAFGLHALGYGKRVAVLAVDPTSFKSRGSILGDKTRMAKLASSPSAFIRPSPSGGILGGVGKHTRETILVCEAAGFDLILVETVGVGQLEANVVDMVDLTLLLLSPTGGDHIQAMKKGLLELVDLIVVNKADGDLKALAYQMVKEFTQVLKFSPKKIEQKVMLCSALENQNVSSIFDTLLKLEEFLQSSGILAKTRQQQDLKWFWEKLEQYLIEAFKQNTKESDAIKSSEEQVLNHKLFAPLAALEFVKKHNK